MTTQVTATYMGGTGTCHSGNGMTPQVTAIRVELEHAKAETE